MDGKLTYTFADDCPITQLRGITVTGGKFCRIDGAWQKEPDAVRFRERIDGKAIVARITGKPELEAALRAHTNAERERAARLAAIGWPAYQAVQRAAANARAAYDRASEYGYPAKAAAAMRTTDEALAAARVQYPLAAAYARAESYSMAANDQKASAGCKAMAAIESGADALATIQAMEAEWSAAAERAVQNA